MKKLDRLLQVLPGLKSFRKQFEMFGTPSIMKFTNRQLMMTVWRNETNSSISENIVYLVYPDKTVKVEEDEIWRAVEDHGCPEMMVNFSREEYRMDSRTDATVYIRPDIDLVRGEVEYLVRLELERLQFHADCVEERNNEN